MYHLFLVLTIHQMFLKLVQLRLYGLYLNERYMKTIGKQKILIIWLKESNKKARELDQEMFARHDRGCWEEASRYVARQTIFSSLNTIFCSTCHALSNKKEFSFPSSKMVEL